ncbi:MAG: RNA-guided pseudouridylation complex pseudouridine synthase subunit Cbf5 [Candidatus Micrarchaeota archaeon]|nr:RNA-guided pseudouridylation complex pseudouridine synthase subunit Cbf5 [Candidatus Micrarchaeota archaeon]
MSIETILSNSVIILNKPPKIINHEITTWVKKLSGSNRAGHAGTLDPDVSGVVPVALGRATKLLQHIAKKDKTYVGIIKFRNIQGEADVKKLFEKFTGEITQTPPKISAVKKVKRKRTIYYLKFLEQSKENPRLVLFETKVDAGTYIRTLCEDIGKQCGGARMEELRRIAVGTITEDQAVTIHDFIDALWLYKEKNDDSLIKKMLHTPEEFIDYPKLIVRESAVKSLLTGAQLMAVGIEKFPETKKGDYVSLFTKSGMFIGIGIVQLNFEDLTKDKGVAVKIDRIHIQRIPLVCD